MNRKRKSNRGLPARVYVKDNAYQFLSPVKIRDPRDGVFKFWIRLADFVDSGRNEAAMLSALADIKDDKRATEGTMPHLCAEFTAKKLGKYTDEVRSQYKQYLEVIADDFEKFTVARVTTKSCADFLRNNFAEKPNTARKYGALMSKLFRYAISSLGLREDNPMDQIDLGEFEVSRRTVLATHDQVSAIRAAGFVGADGRKTQSGPMFACIIDMTYLLWARALDIRMLKEAQIDEPRDAPGRIRLKPTKTEKSSGLSVDMVITPEIQDVIDRARAIKRDYEVISPYLFPTKKGTPYAKSGLTSMWDRARERAQVQAAKDGREFGPSIQFKDLRALGATDAAKQGENRADIQGRLVHTSGKTTDIYIKESVPSTSAISMRLPWKAR
ncbi:MAG: tyrosine-type recombinase/integrase [Pseudomonadota bacterium]